MAYLRRLSIRSQLLILAGSAIAAILIIILHTYTTMSGMITRSHEEYVNQTVSEIRKNVTSNKDVLFRLMQNISYNEDVQSYLVEQNGLRRYELFKKLSLLISAQKEMKDGILDIVISGNNGSWIDLNYGNRYVGPMKQALGGKENARYVTMARMDNQYGAADVLVFATTIAYKQQGELFNRNLGTLFFIIDPRALVGDQKYTLNQTGTEIYVLDRDRKLIDSNTKMETGTRLPSAVISVGSAGDHLVKWDGKTYVTQAEALPDIDGTIVSMAPKDELLRDLLDIRRTELLVLAICLLVLAVPFMFIINNILRPLRKMIFFMTSAKRDDLLSLRKRLSLQGYLEISILASEFNGLLDETEQLTQRLLETNARLYGTELEKKKSELAFLRSQINPHFLYNTLEAITGIAAVEGQSRIKAMTRALSSIFRYSVKGADIVPLAEEVRMVESYVRIQQIRFEGRFSVRYDFTDEALACRIPRMILQPLVENAIYHGFEPTLKPGLLTVAGSMDGAGTLTLIVADNGAGMEEERLRELRAIVGAGLAAAAGAAARPEPADAGERRSIGLANVHNRIRLMFGEGSGMAIDSVPGEGTQIKLIITDRSEPHA